MNFRKLSTLVRGVLAAFVAICLQGCDEYLSGPLLISKSVLSEARAIHSVGSVEQPFGRYFLWEVVGFSDGSDDPPPAISSDESREFIHGIVDQSGCMSGIGLVVPDRLDDEDECAYLFSTSVESQWLLVGAGPVADTYEVVGLLIHTSTDSALSLFVPGISFHESATRDQDVAQFESRYSFSRNDELDAWVASTWAGVEQFLQDRVGGPSENPWLLDGTARLDMTAVDTREGTCLDFTVCGFQ